MANAFDSDNYPTTEPGTFVLGDRWAWKRDDLGTDYPPADYAFTYSARLQGDTQFSFSITASESGDDYVIEVASTTTSTYRVGTYDWDSYITRSSDSERVRIGSGSFEVLADAATATTDPRTYTQRQIDILRDNIEALNARMLASSSVSDRSSSLADLTEKRSHLAYWESRRAEELSRDRRVAGRAVRNKLRVRFTS